MTTISEIGVVATGLTGTSLIEIEQDGVSKQITTDLAKKFFSGVPDGGTTGQALTKLSATNGDANWQTLTKSSVGLSAVDNTSDANKPISSATQTALDGKENIITKGLVKQFWNGLKQWVTYYFDQTYSDTGIHAAVKNVALIPNVSDVDVGISITPKGNGYFALAVPDGTNLGGNVRGLRAVELQITRNSPEQVASGQASIAIGASTRASGQDAIAIGTGAIAHTGRSVAILGSATGTQAIALGFGSSATGTSSLAMLGAAASGDNSIAIGAGATSNAGVAIGVSSAGSGTNSVVVGLYSGSTGQEGIAIGISCTSEGYGMALGRSCTSGFGGYAIGFQCQASNSGAVSVGQASISNGYGSVSLGLHANNNFNDSQLSIGGGTPFGSGSTRVNKQGSTVVIGARDIDVASSPKLLRTGTSSTFSGINVPIYGATIVTGDVVFTDLAGDLLAFEFRCVVLSGVFVGTPVITRMETTNSSNTATWDLSVGLLTSAKSGFICINLSATTGATTLQADGVVQITQGGYSY